MKEVDITFEGRVVGKANVDENLLVGQFEIEPSDMKYILPDWDPTEGLSIAETQDRIMAEYSEADVSIVEAYFNNKAKGTFEA